MTRRVYCLLLALTAFSTLSACAAASGPADAQPAEVAGIEEIRGQGLDVATFAGGCFWCMEPPFDKLEGVRSTTSGYTGGPETNPSYHDVAYGRTGHAEAVRIVFDPEVVSYERLLEVFWHNIDPTVADRQFCDRGRQYRTAIYSHGEDQHRLALESRGAIEASKSFPGPILTEIEMGGPFWGAEVYHQNYYEKNPVHYRTYRTGCGRDARLRELWGDAAGH